MLRNALGNVPNFIIIVTNNIYDSLGPSTSDYITDCQFCAKREEQRELALEHVETKSERKVYFKS